MKVGNIVKIYNVVALSFINNIVFEYLNNTFIIGGRFDSINCGTLLNSKELFQTLNDAH